MERRKFISSSLFLGAFAGAFPFKAAFAQDEGEVVIVHPPAPKIPGKDGTSVYDKDNIVFLYKAMASFVHNWHGFASNVTGSIGAGFISGAIVDKEPTSTSAFLGLGVAFLGASGVYYGSSALFGMLANDPPRKNYQVDLCKGSIFSSQQQPNKTFPALAEMLDSLDKTTTAVRHFWDSVELWQGAEQVDDQKWMQTHYNSARTSYAEFYKGLKSQPDLTRAAFDEVAKFKEFDFAAILESTKALDGKSFNSIQAMRDIAKGLDSGLPCQDGIGKEIKRGFLAQKFRPVGLSDIDQLVAKLSEAAAMLDEPLKA